MDRRDFCKSGLYLSLAGSAGLGIERLLAPSRRGEANGPPPPAASVIPVVGDGKWGWTQPPQGNTGYLEPRPYEITIGIELEADGNARNVLATTPAPINMPGQKIESAEVKTHGCLARLRQVAEHAGQLVVGVPHLARGQTVSATATLKATLYKEYFGYEKKQFAAEQALPRKYSRHRHYLKESPGIQTRDDQVRKLAARLAGGLTHPWDKARSFYEWVWANIRPRVGSYTSVTAALEDRVGDCEERAAVFTAFCRVTGIPARLVWVPNHNWAEFCLFDSEGKPHWIPTHTAAYSWFGWTGVHELILQKGDKVSFPEKSRDYRLLPDWWRQTGSSPRARFLGEVKPLPPSSGADPGPGHRRKTERGEWVVVGSHKLDDFLRDGSRTRARQGKIRTRPAAAERDEQRQ